jgi:histidine triad (HIT) family protein
MQSRTNLHDAPDCSFCRIAVKEADSAIVFEDDASLGFLDHRPLFPGHCLLIPKSHYPTFAELPAALLPVFFRTAQLLTRAVETALEAQGSFVAINNVVSQSVPHLHLHIVPRRKGDGLRGFFWPRRKYKDLAELRHTQEAIRHAVTSLLDAGEPHRRRSAGT